MLNGIQLICKKLSWTRKASSRIILKIILESNGSNFWPYIRKKGNKLRISDTSKEKLKKICRCERNL